MKRIFPESNDGRFLCCDGINHEWFKPVFKTLIHSIKVCFFQRTLKHNLNKFVEKPCLGASSQQPVITWLGHSTFLIQIAGKNILTDPIFGSLSFVFRRIVPPVISVKDLPKIDYILISHNHYDHMNASTLIALKNQFPHVKALVPMGDKNWFDVHGFTDTLQMTWWQELQENINLKFTFLPANHWSQRTLFDKNKSLWGSWMIQSDDFKIYFAGDTSWGVHFEQIGQQFGSINVALLPVAPGEPRSWMKDSHINAREAVQAFIQLKAQTLIPMHWGTFHLGFDDFYTPIVLLKKSWYDLREQLQNKQLKIMKFGQMISQFPPRIILDVIAQSGKQVLF